jgi:hypothetical protein
MPGRIHLTSYVFYRVMAYTLFYGFITILMLPNIAIGLNIEQYNEANIETLVNELKNKLDSNYITITNTAFYICFCQFDQSNADDHYVDHLHKQFQTVLANNAVSLVTIPCNIDCNINWAGGNTIQASVQANRTLKQWMIGKTEYVVLLMVNYRDNVRAYTHSEIPVFKFIPQENFLRFLTHISLLSIELKLQTNAYTLKKITIKDSEYLFSQLPLIDVKNEVVQELIKNKFSKERYVKIYNPLDKKIWIYKKSAPERPDLIPYKKMKESAHFYIVLEK